MTELPPLPDSAVLVIDMHRGSIEPPGTVFVPDGDAIVPALARLLDRARSAGVPVIYVVHQIRPDGSDARNPFWLEAPSVGDLYPNVREQVIGSRWTKLAGGLELGPGDHVVPKKRYGAFSGNDLAFLLKNLGVNTLVLTGVEPDLHPRHGVPRVQRGLPRRRRERRDGGVGTGSCRRCAQNRRAGDRLGRDRGRGRRGPREQQRPVTGRGGARPSYRRIGEEFDVSERTKGQEDTGSSKREPVVPYMAVGLSTIVHGVGSRKDIERNLRIIEDGIHAAVAIIGINMPVKLIALAEGALTGFTDEIFDIPHVTAARDLFIDVPGPETDTLGALARQYRAYIVVQCKARWPEVMDDRYFNMLFVISPNGEIVHRAAKNHLWCRERSCTPHDVYDRWVELFGDGIDAFSRSSAHPTSGTSGRSAARTASTPRPCGRSRSTARRSCTAQ